MRRIHDIVENEGYTSQEYPPMRPYKRKKLLAPGITSNINSRSLIQPG
ncbi:hypothetical protein WBG78_20025 [Chryseolinea sp. T2]